MYSLTDIKPPKRQDVARAYTAGSGNRQQSPINANVANNQKGNEAGQKATCYECEAQGHFKRNCPKLKNNNNNNNNRGNQVGTGNAQARVIPWAMQGQTRMRTPLRDNSVGDVCRVDGEWVLAVLVSGKRRKNMLLDLAGSTVHCTVFQR
nr:hypothetical protein [Tanacetum cinerariifolium]